MRNWRVGVAVVAVLATSGVGAGWLKDLAPPTGYVPLRILAAALALLLLVVGAKEILRSVFSNYVVVGFVAWSTLTLVWSEDRMATLSTLIGLGTITLLAASLAVLGRTVDIGRTLMWTFTAISIISLLLAILAPGVGAVWVHHPTEGLTFQPIGVFAWNSDLGFSAAVGCVLALGRALAHRSWWLLGVAAFNGFIVWYSNSAASVIVLVAGAALVLLLQGWRWALAGAGLIAVSLIVAMSFLTPGGLIERLFGLLGRSSTLTGRVDLWQATLEQAMAHPLLGAGAGVEPRLISLTTAIHSHNGYVQVLFDRGLVGLAILICLLVISIIYAAKRRDVPAIAVTAMVVVANMANNYFTYASLGLLLIFWVSFQAVAQRGDGASYVSERMRIRVERALERRRTTAGENE